MEEKLDRIIELLEQQNQSLDRFMKLQTTNNFTKQHDERFNAGPPIGNPGAGPDVKAMIEEAKAKAAASMQAQMSKFRG